jgi:ribonuclease G
MSEEILINVTPQETRVAVIENGILQELHVERSESRGIVGNIYKGKVVRILPGMQAAFIEINEQRTAFLHKADIFSAQDIELDKDQPGDEKDNFDITEPVKQVPIQETLHEGQSIIVQVIKDPLGDKGARLTTELTIPARHLVYLPFSEHIGVSQKISDPDERERLRGLLNEIVHELGATGGYIVRTVAESVSRDELVEDIQFLVKLWKRIQLRIKEPGFTGLAHKDIPLILRTMRDLVHDDIERVRIDSNLAYNNAREFIDEIIPAIKPKLEQYRGSRPIFDLFSIEDEINKALEKKVLLKSGGHLVIEQTEAMTTVDVNTGGFVGRRNMEETLFKTNLEATHALARQLRLRNIGGIIIIDFIDMKDAEHKRQVMRALDKSLAQDRVKTFITQMSSLGLVEVTRKRTRESLGRMLCEPCPVCEGKGIVKSVETICYSIFREIVRETQLFEADKYLIIASQVIADRLLDESAKSLQELEIFIGKPINVQVDPLYHQQDYDLILM